MSSRDEFKKKPIHKLVDSSGNIKKVIIPHNVQIGMKNKSINKETLKSLSGSDQSNEFVIRKDQDEKYTRLELNNGFKTGMGTSIRFACGGEIKGTIFQANKGDMYIRTYTDDLQIEVEDSVFIKGKARNDAFKFDANNGKLGIGTTSPDTELHVYGGNVRVGDRATWGGSSATSDVEYGRIELIANKNSGNVQAMIDARDSSSTQRMQLGTRSNHDIMIFTNNTEAIRVDDEQQVGIGKSDPSYKLHVVDSSVADAIARFDNSSTDTSADGILIGCGPDIAGSLTTSNSFIKFQDGTGDSLGFVRSNGSGGVTLANAFTGGHPTVIESDDYMIGLIVESTGELWANNPNNIETAIPKVRLTTSDNATNVYGVLADLDTHDGYKKVWGVGETESQVFVHGLGEGKVWVTNKSGDITNGDYITTSVVPGYGVKQSDGILRNYTVGKCVESVDWGSVTNTVMYDGIEYKKYLIGCTYHCS